MTTDEHILPDVLQPQSPDRQHGRFEDYWTTRNALVDAVRAARIGALSVVNAGRAFAVWLGTPDGRAYTTALDALRAFDVAHGGTPVL